MNALARHLPQMRVPWVSIGQWPTPLTALPLEGRPVWVKHEGDSHPSYGGNKVRTLEAWFGHAQERGARRIWAIGAYGSNHAVATIAHAAAAGLEAAVLVFPQPPGAWAAENCGAILASGCSLVRVRSVVGMPFAAWRLAREAGAIVMPPGGATPVGAFGAMAAAFELAEQIEAKLAPPPSRIVLAVGSTCTTAGLLAGLALARSLGVWRWPRPIVHGVRVTPWPVTSRLRTADLARRTLARVEQLGGPRAEVSFAELVAGLVIDGRELGWGYGRSTPRGDAAEQLFSSSRSPRLDGVYSAKAAAALLRLHRAGVEPLMFWASKSTAVMTPPSAAAVAAAPAAIRRWLARSSPR